MKMTKSRGWIWPKPTNLTCLNMTEMNEFDQKSKILLTTTNIKLECYLQQQQAHWVVSQSSIHPWSIFTKQRHYLWVVWCSCGDLTWWACLWVVIFKKQLIYDFLAGNNYPDSPYSQGVWNLPHKFHLYLIIIIIILNL